MIDLSIDTADLSAEFDLDQRAVNDLLKFTVEEVTAMFARNWDNKAKETLGSTRNEYRNAIQTRKIDDFTASVYLNPASWLANALEEGASGFDMKAGLLNSSKVKYTKNGSPYITIPFRFATPTSLGESSAFAGVMPTVIHRAVLKHEKESSTGLPLGSIPNKYQIPQSSTLRRTLSSAAYSKVAERTSIYEGLKRNPNGAGYVMFRRISLNSAADKFQHPGLEARSLAQKALDGTNIPQIVDIAIDSYLANLGF
jgi:hypothetical protein